LGTKAGCPKIHGQSFSLHSSEIRIRQERRDDAVYSEGVDVNTTTGQATVADEQTKKYLTLLEMSKAIASHRDLSGLFHDLACRLQGSLSISHLGVMLYDSRRKHHRFHLWKTVRTD